MKLLNFSNLFAILFFALALVSCGGGDTGTVAEDTEAATEDTENTEDTAPEEDATDETSDETPAANIVGLAQGSDNLSTLVTALQAAELVEVLNGEGPFTVFAPTNEAFEALGETLTDLLKPENKEKLAGILKYHVVSGKVMAADIQDGAVATVNGAEVELSTADGVKLNGEATVTTADVEASNGVVHIIDKVILPPAE